MAEQRFTQAAARAWVKEHYPEPEPDTNPFATSVPNPYEAAQQLAHDALHELIDSFADAG